MNSELVAAELPADDECVRVYRELISEAYIEPIRTVVVVDDEFPTLDHYVSRLNKQQNILSDESESSEKKYDQRNLDLVSNLLKYSREQGREWLVDIHDGCKLNVDENLKLPEHLQHSDLMILDYHLKGESFGGDDAIGILRMLAASNHFNMVAVYTKGSGNDDVSSVFRDIVFGLSVEPVNLKLLEREEANVEKTLDDLGGDVVDRIVAELGLPSILDFLNNGCDVVGYMKSGFWKDIVERVNSNIGRVYAFDRKAFAKYILRIVASQYRGKFAAENFGQTKFSIGDGFNWIRTDTLFLTVVGKRSEPDKIPGKLLNALMEWRPTPHQLVMSKMRAQMDEYGVHAESGVLRDRVLQAGWLEEFFDKEQQDQALSWRSNMAYHWMALGDTVRREASGYSRRVSDYLNLMTREKAMSNFYMDKFEKSDISLRMNSFNSFKVEIDDVHLTTGHVFRLSDGDYWVCLSPACDLVPGQKSGGRFKEMDGRMPFIGVKLYPVSDDFALDGANSNSHIFFDKKIATKSHSFHPDGDVSAAPHWDMLYAADGGRFKGMKTTVSQVIFKNGGPVIKNHDLCIVAQLRYEYALNLLNKMSASLSRVGLDYKEFNSKDKK